VVKKMTDKNVGAVIGAFYELPDGSIARTYGWSGSTRMVAYYFDTDAPLGSIFEGDMTDWKLRKDLTDFPNARDPRLPADFDLHWDIKHMSELERVLRSRDHDDIEEICAMVTVHGIAVDEALLNPSQMKL
jgi:hypothetical protein